MSAPSQGVTESDGLLAAARAGDRDALGQLIARYRPYLLKVAGRLLAERLPGEGSSVVQEGSLAAIEHFGNFRGPNAAVFLAWLARIVRNRALERLRRTNRLEALAVPEPLADDEVSPSEQAIQREEAARLRAAMERLPDNYRQVLDLRNFENWSYAAIAAHLGAPEGTVRQWWVRAVRKLRAELGE